MPTTLSLWHPLTSLSSSVSLDTSLFSLTLKGRFLFLQPKPSLGDVISLGRLISPSMFPGSSLSRPATYFSLCSVWCWFCFLSCSCFPTTMIALIGPTCVSFSIVFIPYYIPLSLPDCYHVHKLSLLTYIVHYYLVFVTTQAVTSKLCESLLKYYILSVC